ncbi:hypothetical protein HZC09_02295 [Candidatus Micrarchaeota archaeon]|nr:hypothetical protein [Candidatus Micrarchaeota archaeon]
MQKQSTESVRLSGIVGETVSDMSFLHESMRLGLLNLTALARMIKPTVDKRLGGENVTVEAITMALRRYTLAVPYKGSAELFGIISECKMNIQSDMTCVNYPYSEEFMEQLNHLKGEIQFEGEKMYVIQRSDEISVITHTKFMDEVKKVAGTLKPLSENRNLALLTIAYPKKGYDIPGLYNFFISKFNDAGVNLWNTFSSYSKISFLVNEDDAVLMYDRLNKAFKSAKELAEVI